MKLKKSIIVYVMLFLSVFVLDGYHSPVQAATLSASPVTVYYGPNKTFTVTFSGAPGNQNDWIGIFKADAGNRSYLNYQYLAGKKSGTLTFAAPVEVGKYNFRMWEAEWTNMIGVSNQVSVEYPPATLQPSITSQYIGPNKKISVAYSNAPGFNNDWIGMFKVGAEARSWVSYQYLQGKTSGTLEFVAPEVPGQYEFRMWTNEYTAHLITSKSFAIDWGPISMTPTVQAADSKGIVKVSVQFTGAPGFNNDWIGIFKVGAGERSYTSYQYLAGKTSGSLTFECPNDGSKYEFRMWANEWTKLLGTSSSFSPGVPGTPPGGPGSGDKPFTLKAYPADNKVYLEWTTPSNTSNVIGYNIYRKTADTPYKTPITDFPIKTLNYIDPNAENGIYTCYIAKVVYKDKSESAPSNEVCVTPHRLTPTINIPDNATTNQSSYTFTGKVDPGSTVKVNGTLIPVGADGSFSATVKLNPGKNTITIQVTNKAGDTTTITKTITLTSGGSGGKVTILLTIGKKIAYVNGQAVTLDVAPFIDKGRTFVPFRFIGESLGAQVGYTTDASGRVNTVSYKLGSTSITLYFGKKEAVVNGRNVKLDVPPQIVQGRTVVPIRFVTEALGCQVEWDGEKQEILIKYPA